MGPDNATRAVSGWLGKGNVAGVITSGFAGALNPDLKPGEVVYDVDSDFGRGHLLSMPEAKPARFHTTSTVITTTAEKRELRRQTGADAVEMESGAIRALCRQRRIPSATVRVISDTASEDLPLDFNRFVGPGGCLAYGRILWAMAVSPKTRAAMLRLRQRTQMASQNLGAALTTLIVAAPPLGE
jgi:nucleoside phosphorylase